MSLVSLPEIAYRSASLAFNPSTVVAIGAAVEAAKLSGLPIGPMMVDIRPHSLGIECLGDNGVFNNILIRRNTPLPHTASDIFYKIHPNQKRIEIKVYQGESHYTHMNQFLGSFHLEDLLNSNQEILVKFELDRSGLLHVTATDMSTGKQESKEIKRGHRSRVKHASLADLESVKIATETVLAESLEDNEDEALGFERENEYDEVEGIDWAELDETVEPKDSSFEDSSS